MNQLVLRKRGYGSSHRIVGHKLASTSKHGHLVLVLLVLVVRHTAAISRNDAFVGYTEAVELPDTASVARMWRGYATAGGTRTFSERFKTRAAHSHYRTSPVDSLTLSSLGIGTYLGGLNKETDKAVAGAIVTSLDTGWNVIDTAANYRDGRAELSVGQALKELREKQQLSRSEVFISTKAGFLSSGLKGEVFGGGDVVGDEEIVSGVHCMHPKCLEVSLKNSLKTMNVETVDLLYLHNAAEMQLPEVGIVEFKRRLKAAFGYFEEARQQGLIRAYGMAAWDCFRLQADQSVYTSLSDILAIAQEAGGQQHGFKYIQLPINIAMPEAWQLGNQPSLDPVQQGHVTILEAAQQARIGVFSSGPLLESNLLRTDTLRQALEIVSQLEVVQGVGAKLLQMARSTPLLTTALIGQKAGPHVNENLRLTSIDPLSERDFRKAFDQLSGAYLSR